MERLYLLDYENSVITSWLDNVDLTENDEVVLFYSLNKNKIEIADLDRLLSSKVKLQLERVDSCSKNAMDFCLITYIGLRLGIEGRKDDFNIYIVSNDRDYEVPINYLNSKGYDLKQITINEIKDKKDEECKLESFRTKALELNYQDIKELLNQCHMQRLKPENVLRSLRRFLNNANNIEEYESQMKTSMDKRVRHYYSINRPNTDIFLCELNKAL